MSDPVAPRNVLVSHPTGLCLRGASAIARLAQGFEAKIEIVKGEQRVHATDVLQVLSLTAVVGTQLVLEAVGPDAEEALDALAALFEAKFNLAD
jgi:phosphotransferase system HPr (HPr) family protein